MPGPGRRALVLALLVGLAGCTAFGAVPGTPTASSTSTPAWPAELPPGVNRTTVTSPLDLARAHTAVLIGQTFTVRSTTTVRTTDGIRLGQVHTVRRVGRDGRFVHRTRFEGVVPSSVATVRAVDAFSNGTVTVVRFRPDDRNKTLVSPAAEATIQPYDVIQKGPLYALLSVTRPTVQGPLRRGGTASLHVTGANGTTTFGYTEATNVTFEALIAPSGLIHRYALTYRANDTSYTGWQGRIERRVGYVGVGTTTVRRPAWVSTAIPNATEVPPGR